MECECLSGFILSLVAFLCVHILMAAWLRNLTRQHMFLSQVGLSEQIKGSSNGAIPKKVIDAPFVQIPLGVTEDRLVGTVDIEASMKVCSLEHCMGMHRFLRSSTPFLPIVPICLAVSSRMYINDSAPLHVNAVNDHLHLCQHCCLFWQNPRHSASWPCMHTLYTV